MMRYTGMIRNIVILIFLSGPVSVKGQQMPLYSQYMMNQFLVNPAVAGYDGTTIFNLTAREQWVGFESSPRTYALCAQGRILKRALQVKKKRNNKRILRDPGEGRVGVGGYIFNDQNGLIDRTGFQLSYAYHIFMEETQLSFGLAFSAFQFSIKRGELSFAEVNEPMIYNGNRMVLFVPDANFGLFYTNFQHWAGFSIAQLFQSPIRFNNENNTNYRMLRQYFLSGGTVIPLNLHYNLEPSVLIRFNERLDIHSDINVKVDYEDLYWGALSYRTSKAIILMAGVKVNKFSFGYSFDYTLNNIQKYTFGSHEIMLELKLGSSQRKTRWRDRF